MKEYLEKKFKLLSVQFVSGFEVVFAVDESGDGLLDLVSRPIEAIGVAEVYESLIRGDWFNGKWTELSRTKTETWTDVVALELEGGFWQVLNENDNYAGMMKSGGNIENAIGNLTGKYLGRLRSIRR
jgi:hypothetical protein